MLPSFEKLENKIICCRRCPRLVQFREKVSARKAFGDERYWRKPLPGFGDCNARLLILGLAPAAHGGNRTGRVFTGDESARFLMRALYQAGFANQSTSESVDDDLKLIDCYMTAIVKCAPPENRPVREEFTNCCSYFDNEFFLLKKVEKVLALGKWAFDGYLHFLKRQNVSLPKPMPAFKHGAKHIFKGWPTLYGSYHPSPQNTCTRKLTERMCLSLLQKLK